MVMKDKVIKYNHKKGYYTTRKVVLASLVMTSAFFACFIPTYINSNVNQINEQAKAENIEEDINTPEEVLLNY